MPITVLYCYVITSIFVRQRAKDWSSFTNLDNSNRQQKYINTALEFQIYNYVLYLCIAIIHVFIEHSTIQTTKKMMLATSKFIIRFQEYDVNNYLILNSRQNALSPYSTPYALEFWMLSLLSTAVGDWKKIVCDWNVHNAKLDCASCQLIDYSIRWSLLCVY